jgi:GcrA cell cycle regulator
MNDRGPQTNTVWTAEMIAELKRYVGEKWSGPRIAQKLGVSRGAVVRKCRRENLQLCGEVDPSVWRENGRQSALKIKASPRNPVGNMPTAPAKPLPVRVEPPGQATIHTLRASQCRWPIGDPHADSFTFCGKPAPGERSYCPFHHTIAHQPLAPKAPKTANDLARSLRRHVA